MFDKESILDIKIEPDIDTTPHISENMKSEDSTNNIGNEIDVKYNIGNLLPESTTEQWMNIKKEEIDIKDEIPTTSIDLQNYSAENVDNKTSIVNKSANLSIQNQKIGQDYRVNYKTYGTKSFVCNLCEYKSLWKCNLIKHARIHTGEKPFQCNLCEYKSVHKNALKDHVRIHTGEKPFQCSLCDYKSAYKSTLKDHVRIHTGEKPFQCNLCKYKSAHRSALKDHARIRHAGEKPFQCKMCEYKCTRKNHLETHMRTHTGEKPFNCNLCEYKSAKKSNLTSHIRTHTR